MYIENSISIKRGAIGILSALVTGDSREENTIVNFGLQYGAHQCHHCISMASGFELSACFVTYCIVSFVLENMVRFYCHEGMIDCRGTVEGILCKLFFIHLFYFLLSHFMYFIRKSKQRFQSIIQSINQPVNQSVNPPTDRPTDQPSDQPTNQPTNQPASQPTNQPTNQSISQSIHQQSQTRIFHERYSIKQLCYCIKQQGDFMTSASFLPLRPNEDPAYSGEHYVCHLN